MFKPFAFFLFLIAISGLITFDAMVGFAAMTESQSRAPCWIWANEKTTKLDEANETKKLYTFQHTFEVTEPVRMARLRFAADFCLANVAINGKHLVTVEPYSETIEIEATNEIAIGTNTLTIQATKVPGPTALAASLSLGISNQHALQTMVTDDSWTCTIVSDGASALVEAKSVVSIGNVSHGLWGIGRKSSKIDPTENYEQWRQAVAGSTPSDDKFWTVPGFEMKLLRNAESDEGSWVSMAFDPKGRLTIAREEKGLLRMTIADSKLAVDNVEFIHDELLECRGLLYAHNALYANANDSKGLYRLRDTDGDDSFDEVRLLRAFPGGVGHGRNDLALGPEGWIYSIHGDSVDMPTSDIVDRTSPFRDKLRSSVKGQGHVLRTDPDGTKWEVVCSGLRNPFGLSVNPQGDWFAYDADAEFDMGTPWYRPTRVVQLVSGADYGWRAVTGKWPPYFADHADNAMPTLDIGKGSPTAVLFATEARFPDEYRRALLILDWTYGRVLAVHMVPRGAGYRANAETFLQGRPLNVTDLAIGLDGALYIITGGRKTQSSLYRIAFTGKLPTDEMPSPHEQRCNAHALETRDVRLQLEAMHVANRDFDSELVWQHLDSPDWNLRHAARIALEHQAIEKWQSQALAETRIQASIEASLAMLRSGDASISSQVLDRLLRIDLNGLGLSQAMGVLQCYSLLANSAIETLQPRRTELIDQLRSFWHDKLVNEFTINRCGNSFDMQGECASLLARLHCESVVEETFATLLGGSEQEQRLSGLFALRNISQGWSHSQRRDYFHLLNEGENFVRGEGMAKFLKQIRDEATATFSDSERTELAELIAPQANAPNDISPWTERPKIRQWTMGDLESSLTDEAYKPDAVRGKATFEAAQCNRCHRSGARGPAVGPDLTHVASRFSRKDILLSIIEPSHVIAENYRSVQVLTTDGRNVSGRLLIEGDYRSQKLSIAIDPLKPSETIEVDKSEIESIKESPISPMPVGLLDSFHEHEILDLLEFLRG